MCASGGQLARRLSTQGAPCFGQLPPNLVFDAVPLLPGQLQRLLRQVLLSPVQPHGTIAACVCGCCHPMAIWSTPYQVCWCRMSKADVKVYLHQVPDAFSKAALLPEGLAQQVIALQSKNLPHRADCASCESWPAKEASVLSRNVDTPLYKQCWMPWRVSNWKGSDSAPSCCEGRA